MPRIHAVLLIGLLAAAGCQRRAETALDKLKPCTLEEGPTDAFCGKLSVYEDRDAQKGRQIDLKIVVLPALRRDPKSDPIFYFQGGPGAGAASLATAEAPMFRRYQNDRDIVLIDQRGTGKSNSLACINPDDFNEDFENINIYQIQKIHACMEKLQQKADLTLYTTPIAMDDIDDVRRYLDYGEINIWGGSYGTRAALVYLKRHEANVRSVVLDSVAPPDMKLPLYMARDGQRALDRMFDECSKDAACSREFPDLRQVTADLFKRLQSRPRVKMVSPLTGKPVEFPLGNQIVAAIVYQMLYDPAATSLLPRLLWDAGHGNYQGLLSSASSSAGVAGMLSEGMFLSVVCSEDMPRITPDDVARESNGRFFGSTMFDMRMKPCEFWPKGKIAGDYYEPSHSSKPVLVLSGADDPVTPPVWGEAVAKELKNAKQFIAPGIGHGVSTHGCAPELIGKLFDTASVAELNGKCLDAQHRPPFFVNYTGPAANPQLPEKKP